MTSDITDASPVRSKLTFLKSERAMSLDLDMVQLTGKLVELPKE